MEKTMMQKLLEAGVSADIVLKLHMEDDAAPAAQEEPKASEEPKDPVEPKAQEESKAQEEPKQPVGTDPVLAAIEKLTGAIQAGNIRGTYQRNAPLTTDEILGTILKGEPDETEEK